MFNKNIRYRTFKKEKKYENGYIYLIRCLITNEKYVGSSYNKSRWTSHKRNSKCENEKRGQCPIYKHMRRFGIENFKFTKIEDWPCNNKWELCRRETYWQVQYNVVENGLNDRYAQEIPIYEIELQKIIKSIEEKTIYEYEVAERRDHYKNYNKKQEYSKKYYEENKEEIRKKETERYATNEKYREDAKERSKKWNEENHDKKLERDANYRKENRLELRKKANVMIPCDCGIEISKSNKARHEKTNERHLEYLRNLEK